MKTRQDSPVFRHQPFPALEETLIADIVDSRGKDPLGREWFLVPSRNLRRRLRSRLAAAGIPTFNLRFLLFPEMAEAILLRDPEASFRRRLPPGADRLVLEGVARRILDPESHFFPVLEHGGFLTALGRSVGDLFHAGVDPDRLLEVMRVRGDAARIEIARVYAGVHARFNEIQMETVAQRIQRAAHKTDRLPDGRVRIYGFYDLNGVQRRMIRKLTETHRVTAYVPRVEGEGSAWSAAHRAWLAGIGFTEIDVPEMRAAGNPMTPVLRCFSAAGERREAEEVVRRVLGRLRSGISPDRVAVLYRDAEPYGDLLERLFARAGVPIESGEPRPLARTRPARALRLLLKAARSNASRRAVLDFLDAAAPMAPVLPRDDALAIVARWEAWTIDAGITRGRDVWRARLGRLARKPERPDDPGGTGDRGSRLDRDALARLIDLVPAFLDALMELPGKKRWSDLVETLMNLGETWLSRDPGWEAVRDVVVEMGRLDAVGEPASLGLFETLLEDRLASMDEPRPEDDRARVLVGGVMAARGLQFEHVFLVGLTENVFPRPARQDPLLPDSQRSLIEGPEGALPLRRAGAGEEAFLFALALESGADRTLSWSRIEPAEARPRLPSVFLLDAVSRFRQEDVADTGLDRAAERVPLDLLVTAGRIARATPGDAVPHDPSRFIDAWNAIDAAEFDRLIVAGASGTGRFDRLSGLGAPELRQSVERHRLRWRAPSFTTADGFIVSECARKALALRIGTDRSWSASRLETYAACPFRFFIETVLGVERLEPPEELDRIAPLDKGSLIHAILRSFLSSHGKRLRAGITDSGERADLHAALQATARAEISRTEIDTPVGYPLIWSVDAGRFIDDLAAWLDFELDRAGPLSPEAFELSFGGRSARPGDIDHRSVKAPVRLDLPGLGSVAFQGRIDRVDLAALGKRARVIDYKTGRKRDGTTEIGLEGGLHLQLPIYLLALREFFPDVTRAEAEYLFLGNDPRRVTYAAPDYPEPSIDLLETLRVLLSGIRAGRFFAYPVAASRCSPCRYASVCGVGIEDRFALKRDDDRIAEHLKLRGDGSDAGEGA